MALDAFLKALGPSFGSEGKLVLIEKPLAGRLSFLLTKKGAEILSNVQVLDNSIAKMVKELLLRDGERTEFVTMRALLLQGALKQVIGSGS